MMPIPNKHQTKQAKHLIADTEHSHFCIVCSEKSSI